MDEELFAERCAREAASTSRNYSMYMPMFALKPNYTTHIDAQTAMRWWPTPKGIGGPHP